MPRTKCCFATRGPETGKLIRPSPIVSDLEGDRDPVSARGAEAEVDSTVATERETTTVFTTHILRATQTKPFDNQ